MTVSIKKYKNVQKIIKIKTTFPQILMHLANDEFGELLYFSI